MREIDVFAEIAEPLADGSWVNSNIARIVEIIHDYDPDLEVRWIPRDKRAPDDDVFQIVDTRINKVAFTVKDEANFNETVLDKIFESDAAKARGGPLALWEKMEIHNRTVELMKAKKWEDQLAEKQEMLASIIKSPLNAYTHNGYRYDLHPSDQPKKVIIDAGVRYQKPREAPIRRPGWGSDN